MPRRTRIGADDGSADLDRTIHQPHGRPAIIVLPKNVGLAVAVEVARAFDVPIRTRIGPDHSTANLTRAVHQPDLHTPVVILPQDVGLAVAVEIAGSLDVPRCA